MANSDLLQHTGRATVFDQAAVDHILSRVRSLKTLRLAQSFNNGLLARVSKQLDPESQLESISESCPLTLSANSKSSQNRGRKLLLHFQKRNISTSIPPSSSVSHLMFIQGFDDGSGPGDNYFRYTSGGYGRPERVQAVCPLCLLFF